jgi:hypothetical protein
MRRTALTAAFLLLSAPALGATCSMTVDGAVFIDGPCEFRPLGDGGFQISNGFSFAYVYVEGGHATGFWNGEEHASHAHEKLGTLTRDGACWRNKTARVCAYQ